MIVKIFEEYNAYYTQITSDQYWEYIKESGVNIDKGVKPFVQEFISKKISNKIKVYFSYYFAVAEIEKLVVNFSINDFHNVIDIIQLEDEYFLVRFNHPHHLLKDFRCDQIDGLIECLKHLIKYLDFGNTIYSNDESY